MGRANPIGAMRAGGFLRAAFLTACFLTTAFPLGFGMTFFGLETALVGLAGLGRPFTAFRPFAPLGAAFALLLAGAFPFAFPLAGAGLLRFFVAIVFQQCPNLVA